ncbi:hypothetical protein QF037_006295 [Streptomyces canus]|nr:hypothetical protein [Streptomyces canus]
MHLAVITLCPCRSPRLYCAQTACDLGLSGAGHPSGRDMLPSTTRALPCVPLWNARLVALSQPAVAGTRAGVGHRQFCCSVALRQHPVVGWSRQGAGGVAAREQTDSWYVHF